MSLAKERTILEYLKYASVKSISGAEIISGVLASSIKIESASSTIA